MKYAIKLILFLLINIDSMAQEVTLIAGGDVEWSRIIRQPEYYYGSKNQSKKIREDGWRRISYLATPESKAYVEKTYNLEPDAVTKHHMTSIPLELTFNSDEERDRYPFQKIKSTLEDADFAYFNLETPLSDKARQSGSFLTPESFADAIKWVGIDFVSTANNHAYDAEGEGITDTKNTLEKRGIGVFGTGKNLEQARAPHIIKKDGISIAFLAYTYGVNPTNTSLGLALPNRSGAAPMDPFLIKEDINSVRDSVDFVVLSLHWGIENKQDIHPAAIVFGHEMLDAGADAIIGHHPHMPRGIEIYKGKPIIYSLGNFIFGHAHTNWMDNILAKIYFSKEKITKVEIIPIAGAMKDIGQPYVLSGKRAKVLLKDIMIRSERLNTKMKIKGNIGVINIID